MRIRRGADTSYVDPFTPRVAVGGVRLSVEARTPESVPAADSVLTLRDLDSPLVAQRTSLVVDTRKALSAYRGMNASIVTV